MDLKNYTALSISSMIKSKELSVTEVVSYYLEKARNDDLNAYITINNNALKRAAEVEKGILEGVYTSPLAGVPIAVKDNICTKDIKTTCGSKMLSSFVPQYNATVIEKLEAAGMIIIGKLNMDEFAMGSTGETSYFGSTLNPHDKNRVAGGSSSGAAAAVADDLAPIALGSDTGGSIRQPAAYCGVVGFKPTYGTVSRYGLIAYASSLDQIGPIARSTEDAAALLAIIKGVDKRDSTTIDYHFNLNTQSFVGLKIALLEDAFWGGIDRCISDKVLKATELLKSNGAKVDKVEFPLMNYLIPAYYIIASAEASSNLSRYDGVKFGYRSNNYSSLSEMYSASRSEGFGKEVKKRIMLGTFVLSTGYYDAYYRKALQVKALIKEAYDKLFSEYDVIITPTTPSFSPLLGESLGDTLTMYKSDLLTVGANLAGLPSISLPCGKALGMPIGLQLTANRLCDGRLLSVASELEKLLEVEL